MVACSCRIGCGLEFRFSDSGVMSLVPSSRPAVCCTAREPNGIRFVGVRHRATECYPATITALNATPRQIGLYTMNREIGRGGMSEVYLARDER